MEDGRVLVVAEFSQIRKNSFMLGAHLDVSGVIALMEISLQNRGTSSVRVDVGQNWRVPDDVFMITLIKRWRKKCHNPHRNLSRQWCKRS